MQNYIYLTHHLTIFQGISFIDLFVFGKRMDYITSAETWVQILRGIINLREISRTYRRSEEID